MARDIVQVRRLRSPAALRDHLGSLGVDLPVADEVPTDGALARDLDLGAAGLPGTPNRWAVLPMEGWDATPEGRPTDLVRRRWRRFGESGAGLVWGGEAVAVVPGGRANPRQLCIGSGSVGDLTGLREELTAAHAGATGGGPPPVVGLQLTHSGRWARPEGRPAPRTAYRHPLLDARVGATDASVLTDAELDDLVGAFVGAARVAAEAGFDFVDVKQCHGYLGHELLTAHERPGPYGGDLAGRSRWVCSVLDAIAADVPHLGLATRLSLYDQAPHRTGADGTGEPAAAGPYRHAFGGDGTGVGTDLTETHELLHALQDHGVRLLCSTAGSPYYVPHIQRPAYFPPSDGYQPFRDPLVDVANLLAAAREVTATHPDLAVVGSGFTYLQDWLANVAEAVVREGWMHAVGIGRMVLSHPTLPADVLAGRPPTRKLVCRTFSDCTTAPRHGLVSGCYPLDDHYRDMPERVELAAAKKRLRSGADDDTGTGGPDG